MEIFSALTPVNTSVANDLLCAVKFEKAQKPCLALSDLAVNGSDIRALCGNDPSRVGKILNCLLSQVIEDPAKNNRDFLLNAAQKLKDCGF